MNKFSVVIPTYNRADYIGATLASVFAQTFTDFEVIVADDGSTDDTLKVLAPYGSRVRVLTQANKGEGGARNLGVQAATGQYIAFIDSDDLWFPWTLEMYARCIDLHREPVLVMSSDRVFQRDEELQNTAMEPLAAECHPDYFAASRRFYWRGVNGNAIKRSAMEEIGSFNETRMVGLDIDYLLRLGTHRGFVKIEQPITFGYRVHPTNITHNAALIHRGIRYLIDQEKAGRYPGGPQRKWDRRRLIAFHARAVSVRAARAAQRKLGWDLYRGTLGWNLRLGKWKYVLGFPAIAAFGARGATR